MVSNCGICDVQVNVVSTSLLKRLAILCVMSVAVMLINDEAIADAAEL